MALAGPLESPPQGSYDKVMERITYQTRPQLQKRKKTPPEQRGKSWYIFWKGHHRGPYSREEIVDLYDRGMITETSLVWCKGRREKSWEELHIWDDFKGEVVPPIPAVSPENQESLEDREEKKMSLKSESLKPLESSLSNILEKRNQSTKSFSGPNKRLQRTFLLLGATLFLMATLALYHVFSSSPKQKIEEVFLGLNQQDYLRLSSVRDLPVEKNMARASFELALNRQRDTFWLSSNFPEESEVSLRLFSQEGKILSSSPVEIRAKAELRNGVAIFNRWELIRGSGFLPGVYTWEAFMHHPEIELPIKKGEILLGNLEAKDLAARLGERRRQEHREDALFLENLNQSLLLFTTSLNQMESYALENLGLLEDRFLANRRLRPEENFTYFTQKYAQHIAPLLQEVTINSYQNLDQERASWNSVQSLLEKDLGDMPSRLHHLGRDMIGLSAKWNEQFLKMITLPRQEMIRHQMIIQEDVRAHRERVEEMKKDYSTVLEAWNRYLTVEI